MSLGSIFGVARSALNAQQLVIQTAGHNIANAETVGFSRQRVELTPEFPQRFPYGTVGTGVRIDDVRRARDELLDVTYRKEAGGAASTALRRDLLGAIEGILGEPSENGLAAAMDAYWSSWSDLANTPTSPAARSVVQQRAGTVAQLLNGFDERLGDLRTQTQLRLENGLVELNALTREVSQLNGQIVQFEVTGKQANDLRDQRDRAIDRLSQLGDVRVLPRPDGSVGVVLGNNTLVDGIHDRPLRIAAGTGANVALATVAHPDAPLLPLGGELQAMVDVLNGSLAETQERLDGLANVLAESVNAIHMRGNDGLRGANAAHLPFFVDKTADPGAGDPRFVSGADPFARPLAKGTVTARTIAVNPEIATNATRIATTSSLVDRPGDNDVALAMAGLRTASSVVLNGVELRKVVFPWRDRSVVPPASQLPPHPFTGPTAARFTPTSLADQYRATTSGLAVQVKDSTSDATVRATLAEQADQRRMSISGVNIDEELTTLMRAQQAYAAAAKVISVTDEMMRSLVEMV